MLRQHLALFHIRDIEYRSQYLRWKSGTAHDLLEGMDADIISPARSTDLKYALYQGQLIWRWLEACDRVQRLELL